MMPVTRCDRCQEPALFTPDWPTGRSDLTNAICENCIRVVAEELARETVTLKARLAQRDKQKEKRNKSCKPRSKSRKPRNDKQREPAPRREYSKFGLAMTPAAKTLVEDIAERVLDALDDEFEVRLWRADANEEEDLPFRGWLMVRRRTGHIVAKIDIADWLHPPKNTDYYSEREWAWGIPPTVDDTDQT